jgi:hypothetical protein
MATVLSANPAGAGERLLSIAPARYPGQFDWQSAPGIPYLAFPATIPLTGVAGPPAIHGPPPMTRQAVIP